MVEIVGNEFILGSQQWSITRGEFRSFLAKHVESDPITNCVEGYAKAYVDGGFPLDRTKALVSAICRWGGNQRQISVRALKNDADAIKSRLEAAHLFLRSGKPKKAIGELTKLEGLGMSYGTKHLRFLSPERAVVFDDIIRTNLGYTNSQKGFAEFLDDCIKIRDELHRYNIQTGQKRKKWRVTDVEMAIFAKAKPI